MTYKKSNTIQLLIVLGKEGSIDNEFHITTSKIAEKIDISQQTASRWIEEASSDGYILKESVGQGLAFKFTKKGISLLQTVLHDLQFIFNEVPHQIRGQLSKGLGEGGYYISLPGYMNQFKKILGWAPFPGTLNIKLVTEEDQSAFDLLAKLPHKLVEGFFHEETKRNLGKVYLHYCSIHYLDEETRGAIIIPDRTHHQGVMEVLAPFSIREKFRVNDGDTITIKPQSISEGNE